MSSSRQPVALVIGGSRGIGRQISLDLARSGYAVVVSGKSQTASSDPSTPFPPDPNSNASTITTVVREILSLPGHPAATAIPVDVRSPESISSLFARTVEVYGRLDVLVYNAGAIWWSSVLGTPLKRYKLMQAVNVDGLYASIQCVLPLFEKNGWKGRIVVVSPPIYSRFFRGKTAYAMGKTAMSVLTKGLAMDFERDKTMREGMAITSLWPATAVESAATRRAGGGKEDLRKATVFSDAVLAILRRRVEEVNGLLAVDEDFLREFEGKTEFGEYSIVEGANPRRIMPKRFPDLTVEEQADEGDRIDSNKARAKL